VRDTFDFWSIYRSTGKTYPGAKRREKQRESGKNCNAGMGVVIFGGGGVNVLYMLVKHFPAGCNLAL